MKLKALREHYCTKDGGITWTPKSAFESEKDIEMSGYDLIEWYAYSCNVCGKLHITDVIKRERNKPNARK